jgi:hypothetical protein
VPVAATAHQARTSLVEARPGAHIEQVLHRAALPCRAAQRGDVLRHPRAGVEHAVAHEHADERRGERLRHRHQQVRVAGAHAVDVVLEDDPPVVDDADGIGVAVRERVGERHGLVLERDRHRAEVERVGRQLANRSVPARDARGASELADVQEAPAVVRALDPVVGG